MTQVLGETCPLAAKCEFDNATMWTELIHGDYVVHIMGCHVLLRFGGKTVWRRIACDRESVAGDEKNQSESRYSL